VPGKHAPESPTSFYLSVGRAAGGALIVLAIVAVIAIAATGTNKKPSAQSSTPPATTPTPTISITPSASATPTATATAAVKVTVNVFNGTTTTGLARGLATKLAKEGYTVKTVSTAAQHQKTTTIYYRAGGKDEAEALLAAHPELGRIQAASSGTPTNALLTVILGDDYRAA
jgi:hypothetical protein